MEYMEIAANSGNSQVTDQAKDCIYAYMEWYGVENPRKILLHHYHGGDFVCLSYRREYSGSNENVYINCIADMIRQHEDNKDISDNYGTIWVCRDWIEDTASRYL